MIHRAKLGVSLEAQVRAAEGLGIALLIHNEYEFIARDRAGRVKWRELVPNLVTTQGLNDTLSKYFKGSAYTAAFYMGLVNNSGFTAFAAGDTAAQIGGTNQWTEATDYSESVRQTVTLGSASAGSINNSAAKCVFSINGTVTIHGAFLATNSAKNNTSGILYGEAALSADRALLTGDTLTIQVTLTQASA